MFLKIAGEPRGLAKEFCLCVLVVVIKKKNQHIQVQ